MNYSAITKAEEIFKRTQKQKENASKEEEKLKAHILEAIEKDGMKVFLQFLKDLSLWDKVDEDINPEVLSYRRGRRDVWLIVRSLIPKDILAQIEIYNKYQIKAEDERK